MKRDFASESENQLQQIEQIIGDIRREFDRMPEPHGPDDGDCAKAARLIDDAIYELAELFDLLSAHCISAPAPGAFLSKVIFNHRQVG